MHIINVALSPAIIAVLAKMTTEELAEGITSEEQLQALHADLSRIRRASQDHDLLTRATQLDENHTWIAFEHPDHGDDGSIMLYSKIAKELTVDTDFYDLGDAHEFAGFLNDHRKMHY